MWEDETGMPLWGIQGEWKVHKAANYLPPHLSNSCPAHLIHTYIHTLILPPPTQPLRS